MKVGIAPWLTAQAVRKEVSGSNLTSAMNLLGGFKQIPVSQAQLPFLKHSVMELVINVPTVSYMYLCDCSIFF